MYTVCKYCSRVLCVYTGSNVLTRERLNKLKCVMIVTWCVRTLRHSSVRLAYQQNVSDVGKRQLNVSAPSVPKPSKDKDMRELEKEIRNDLSIYNRTESKVVNHRRKSTEMVSPRDIEQIVENHVLDAMRKGDLDNLPGFGKPFKEEYENPFLETGLAKINNILMNEGYTPSWILLGKEIREGITNARFELALEKSRLNNPTLTLAEQAKLQLHQEKFEKKISKLNEMVDKHNLEVPLIRMQRVPFSVDNELKNVLGNYQHFIPADFKETDTFGVNSLGQTAGWKGIWGDIVGLFK